MLIHSFVLIQTNHIFYQCLMEMIFYFINKQIKTLL